MPSPTEARPAPGGRDNPVRRRLSRRYPAAAGSVQLLPSPPWRQNRAASRAGAPARKPAPRLGNAGIGTPRCTAQSRARIAAGRDFISAGMNNANRPDRTPIARNRGRRSADKVSSSTPGIRPSASVSRCTGPRSAGWLRARASAANSGARSARICPSSHDCSRTRTRSRSAPSRNSLSSTWTRGRNGMTPRTSLATGTESQVSR